jgi:cytochrome c-type biogenesis protein CcmH/NrfG
MTDTVAEATAAIARGERDPFHYVTIAWDRAQAGDRPGAFDLLQQALRIAPNDPVVLTTMAVLYREERRLRDAVLHCDAAIRACPTYAAAWLERAFVLSTGGSFERATESYAEAARLDPGNAAAWAGMAMIAARKGDHGVVRGHAEKALAVDPDNLIACSALATVEIEEGNYAAVVERLEPLLDGNAPPSSERANALNVLGDAFDKLGRVDDAFQAYEVAKSEFAAVHADQFPPDRETHRAFIERIGASLVSAETANWAIPETGPVAHEADKHIFLLGYPRSGTTLVENVLASLPDVLALEERPTLREADEAFLGDDAGFAKLVALSAADAMPFREAYWAKVKVAGLDVTGRIFVDMDPLKGIRLPLIARLFPNARILIMRRDPRDIVWSCFHTNFALTSTSYEFTSLERTARHYDALMRLTQASIESLPLLTHEVRYDALVRDFDTTTRAICDSIGINWSPQLRDFDRTARTRGVSTASAAQVRKPLYDGTRQWERYSAHLEPVLPILQPWIDRFGFDT